MKELIHFSNQRRINLTGISVLTQLSKQQSDLYLSKIPNLPCLHSSSKGDTQELYLHPNSTNDPSGKGSISALKRFNRLCSITVIYPNGSLKFLALKPRLNTFILGSFLMTLIPRGRRHLIYLTIQMLPQFILYKEYCHQ